MSYSTTAARLPTPTATEHRLELQTKLKTALLPKLRKGVRSRFETIKRAADIFGPAVALKEESICDTLCAILETPVGTTAVLQARRSQSGPEGW